MSYSFAELRSVQILELESADYKSLKKSAKAHGAVPVGSSLAVVQNDGARKTVMIPATFNFRPAWRSAGKYTQVIAARIVIAFGRAQKDYASDHAGKGVPLIFLSHSHSDAHVVNQAEIGLRASGMQPWVDRSRLVVGRQWQNEIIAAIQACSALVVFISPDSMRSRYVKFEWEEARRLGKPIIGVMAKACRSVPDELRPYVGPDMGKVFYRGYLQTLFALERVGVIPDGITGSREFAPEYVLARGLMRAPLADERVFYAGRVTHGNILFMLLLGSLLAVEGILNQVVLPIFYAGALLLVTWLIHQLQLMTGVPEMLILHPTGIVRSFAGRETVITFADLDDLAARKSSWLFGTAVAFRRRGSTESQMFSLPAHLRGHRQIAQMIVDAFHRSS